MLWVSHCEPLSAQTNSQPNQTDTAAIKHAILLLGDVDPTVRKNAKAEIESFGPAAISELAKAAKLETTADYEIQIAATTILATLKEAKVVKETDNFVRGEAMLPGWEAFKELTQDSAESRSLFSEIYLKNRQELIRATNPPTPGAARNYQTSYSTLKGLFESPDLAQVCFGMFLLARQQNQPTSADASEGVSAIRVGPSTQQIKFLFGTLSTQKSPIAKLRGKGQTAVLLVRAIIESAPQTPQLLSYNLALIRQIKSTEISPLLLDLAEPQNPTSIRAQAIEHAITLGDKTTFEKLNRYLDDKTEVGKYLTAAPKDTPAGQRAKQQISIVQIRDLILLGNLRLTKQDHTEFGFTPQAINTSQSKIDIKKAGFVKNEAREKAFERFHNNR